MNKRKKTTLDLLRAGGVCLVRDDDTRENEGDFVALGATITKQSLLTMVTLGRGLVCVPLGPHRARAFGLPPMVGTNQDPHGTAFTVSVDGVDTGTGISLDDRLTTIRHLAAPQPDPRSLRSPGHLFPLVGRPGGLETRRGHTEASLELARLAGATDCGVICEVLDDQGDMLRGPGLEALARDLGIPLLTLDEILSWTREEDPVRLPGPWGEFAIAPLAFSGESVVLTLGDRAALMDHPQGPLVRIHSECLTGDVFGSWRCDCGPQLQACLEEIQDEGAGLVFYLRQEGRGIGLHRKLEAYRLQQQGLDTWEANLALGHPADDRSYREVGRWLAARGWNRVRLLSNNPEKRRDLEAEGIQVQLLPLVVGHREENRAYLRCKQERFGHRLPVLGGVMGSKGV